MTGTVDLIRCRCLSTMAANRGFLVCGHCDLPCDAPACDQCAAMVKAQVA